MNSTLAIVIKACRLVRGMEQADVVGCDVRSVARWERGDLPGARYMGRLRAALDLSIGQMDGLVLDCLAGEDARFRIEGPTVLKRLRWDHDDLLAHVLDLERRTIGIEDVRNGGTVPSWSAIFEALPDSWRVLTRGNQVVGLWNMTPLSPAAYGELRAGQLAEGEITIDDVVTFDLPGAADLSLSSIVIDAAFRSPPTFALLIASLLEVICSLGARGVALGLVCVQAWTPQSVLLCRHLGFQKIGTLPDTPGPVPIFETEVGRLLAHPALARLIPGGARGQLPDC